MRTLQNRETQQLTDLLWLMFLRRQEQELSWSHFVQPFLLTGGFYTFLYYFIAAVPPTVHCSAVFAPAEKQEMPTFLLELSRLQISGRQIDLDRHKRQQKRSGELHKHPEDNRQWFQTCISQLTLHTGMGPQHLDDKENTR